MLLLVLVSLFLKLSYEYFSLGWRHFSHFACENTPIKLFLCKFLSSILSLRRNIHQNKRISDQIALNEMVQRCLSRKTRGIVDLKEIESIFVVDHEVKP